jgi:hypothetical protein
MCKKNSFKDRRFELSMNVDQRPFSYPGLVLESYGNLCYVQEQKAGPGGRVDSYGIYRVLPSRDGEQLYSAMIDYQTSTAPDAPPIYGASQKVIKQKFDDMVSAMRLQDSEAELQADRKLKSKK